MIFFTLLILIRSLRCPYDSIGLLPNFGINSTFNIKDLVVYKRPQPISNDPFETPPSSSSNDSFETPTPSFYHQNSRNILKLFWINKLFLLGIVRFNDS